ncbi:DNA mismatch repair protein MutT, partial [Streptomyces anulatus]
MHYRALAATPGSSCGPTQRRSATASSAPTDLAISDESTELRFVAPSELDSLDMHHTQRLRLTHYLAGRSAPYLG